MGDHSVENKRIAKNTLFLYIRMGVVMVIGLYTTRVVLRVLGVEDYGIYNVVGGFVTMFGVLNTTLTSSINRYYNYELGKKDNGNITGVYNAAVRIQLLTALILLVLIEGIGLWYVNNVMVIPQERLVVANWLFQFSVFSMLLIVLQAPYGAAVLAHEKMDYFALVSIVDAVLKLAICFLIQCYGEDKLLTYGVLMFAIAVINFFMYFIYSRIKFNRLRLNAKSDKSLFKSMLSFSGWSLLNPIAYTARGQGCNMVLNYYFGPVLNAAQGVANQVASAIEQLSGNFSVSFRPQIIQSYSSGEYARTKRLMYSMSKISFLLHALFAIPVILEINNLLSLWLGKDSIPEYAAPFACCILVIKWINSLNPPITNVMAATGHIRKINIYTASIVVCNVPIAILLFWNGALPTTMYAAMLGLTIINQFVGVRILCRTFNEVSIKDYIKDIVIPCLSLSLVSLTLPVLVCVFIRPTFGRLLLTSLLSMVSVIASSVFFLNNDEKQLAKSMITSLLKRYHISKR